MTDLEYVAYFSLWSISKAPLLIGGDVRKFSAANLETYSNPEVIAVNQDALGVQGRRIRVMTSRMQDSVSMVRTSSCSSIETMQNHQRWFLHSEDNTIRSIFNGHCLTYDTSSTDKSINIIMAACSENNEYQKWILNMNMQQIISKAYDKW